MIIIKTIIIIQMININIIIDEFTIQSTKQAIIRNKEVFEPL